MPLVAVNFDMYSEWWTASPEYAATVRRGIYVL